MRYSSLVSLALLVLAVACHDAPSAPTPPKPVAARVELKTDQVLLRAGQTLRLSDLVARVTDASGQPITGYALTGTATGGCTLSGDTVKASAESVCRLRARATYVPAQASLAPLYAAAGDSVGPDTAVVVSSVDLGAHRWRAAWRCTGHVNAVAEDGTPVDSVHVSAIVDSVRYAGDASWIPNFGGVAQLWLTMASDIFVSDGRVEHGQGVNARVVEAQRPDSVLWWTGSGREISVRTSAPGALLRYEGGTFCERFGWSDVRGPITFEEF